MIGALFFALACAPSFDRAVELARAGRYAEALEEARREERPIEREQALLYVRHQAGDLDGALEIGRAALREDRQDPWLMERLAYVALTVHLPATALAAIERLEQCTARDDLDPADRARYRALAAEYRVEALGQQRVRDSREAARRRAQITSAVFGVVSLVALGWLALASARIDVTEDPARRSR